MFSMLIQTGTMQTQLLASGCLQKMGAFLGVLSSTILTVEN